MTVTGGRGSGKSSLLAEIPTLHEHRSVLLRANPSESDWRFSGITALLNGIDDPALGPLVDYVASSPRGDLDVADVSTMLHCALRQWSADRTVVVIDDADDLDAASQIVLGFLSRRLAGTGLVLVAGMRHEAPESPFARLSSLRLENLSVTDTVRMLESATSGRGSKAVLHAVAAATHGNPLASIELCNQLTPGQLDGACALPIPLHWNGGFEADLAASVSALPPSARRAINLLSLSHMSSTSLIDAMPGDLGAGVDEIVSAGHAVRTGSSVRIQNQMLRAYVFSAMQPADRTAHHHTLATVAETADPQAWPWHLSHTPAARPDTSISLLRHAVELVRAEETQAGVEYIERALTINPWEAETAARLGTAAEVLFSRGEFVHAKRYVDWAQRITKDGALTLRLTGLDFQMELMKGNSVRPSMLIRLIKELGHHDPGLSACLLSIGGLHMAERWQVEDADQLLGHAEQFLGRAPGEAVAMNQRTSLLAAAVRGNVERVSRAADGGPNSSPASLLLKGRTLTYAENYEGARDLFFQVRNLGSASDANWTETARYFAADNEIRAGNFRSAIALIGEIASSPGSQEYHRGMRTYLLLWRAYSIADAAEAQACLAEAQNFLSRDSPPRVAAQLFACQGHFALMLGDLEKACALLSRAAEIGMQFSNPALLRCESDLVEALMRSGRRREAARGLARMESRSVGMNSQWLRTAVSRARALVAERDHSLELFDHASNAWQKDESLFERARTLLCYAERLAAFDRRKDANYARLRAKALFDEAGATSWTQQVDALLLGNHLRDAPGIQSATALPLSDQERELVNLVARGWRNKEIAASLFVSVRTVEVRLTAIYRKLEVQSRSQLTCLVSTGASAAPGALARETSPLAVTTHHAF